MFLISVVQLGSIDYATGLLLQQRLVELRKSGRLGDILLLLEHTPVITLGRNAKQTNILASPELLARRGVEVFECDRGGDVTFHGPGQLVGYPIFDLRGFVPPDGKRKTLGAIEYVRCLEEVLIRTCTDFGIAAKRICGLTGVWTVTDHIGDAATERVDTAALDCTVGRSSPVDRSQDARGTQGVGEAKIAAIGVHISRAVTSHGFALNVNTDLDYYNLIIPCGITAKPVTSIAKELGTQISLPDVAHSISRNFGLVFSRQMLGVENLGTLLEHSVGVPLKLPEELRQLHKGHKEEDSFRA